MTRLTNWLFDQRSTLYSSLAGAVIGGGVSRLVTTLAGVPRSPAIGALLESLGTIALLLAGVFLLLVASSVDKVADRVAGHVASERKHLGAIDPYKLENYEGKLREEHRQKLLRYLALFIALLVVGIFLIAFGQELGLRLLST